MNLLGVDVGFSATRLTTGFAWRVGGEVGTSLTGTQWSDRSRALPLEITYSVVACDAPILPRHEGQPYRGCEAVIYGGAFSKRCRPGLSHYGRGLPLRQAGTDAASQIEGLVSGLRLAPELEVRKNIAIIEAFPNAFLGVLLPNETYEDSDRGKHEQKSDWMFRKLSEIGTFRHLLSALGWTERRTIQQFQDQAGSDGDHDIRAALVCLLMAGFAASGNVTIVGDPAHGWFWLPPKKFWQPWAWTALETQLCKLKMRFPATSLWNGPVLRQAIAVQ